MDTRFRLRLRIFRISQSRSLTKTYVSNGQGRAALRSKSSRSASRRSQSTTSNMSVMYAPVSKSITCYKKSGALHLKASVPSSRLSKTSISD